MGFPEGGRSMSSDKQSLTKGLFHVAIAKQYFEGFKLSCKQSGKHQAGVWVNKLSFLESDVYSALTPESRDQFIKEIKTADVLVYEEIFRLTLLMNNDQRELLERLATAIVKGEAIEYIGEEK